jgi:hypothetical protein
MALEIRRRDVPLAFVALQKLANIGFKNNYDLSKKLAKNIRSIRLLNEEIEEERAILNKAFAKYDDNNEMVKASLGTDAQGQEMYRIVFEDEQKATEGFKRVMDGEVKLDDAEPFSDAEFKSLRTFVDGSLLEALGPFAPLPYVVASGRPRANVRELAGLSAE